MAALMRITAFTAFALCVVPTARAQEGEAERLVDGARGARSEAERLVDGARGARSEAERLVDGARGARSEAERLVDEARRLYGELDFLGAVDAAQRVLATPGAHEVDRAGALETLGSALIVLDRDERAREAFEALFRLDPYWVVREPSGSPRIRRFVEGVRARVVPDAALDPDVSLHLHLPRAAHAGGGTRIRLDVEGPPVEGARVRVLVRGDGELEWQLVRAEREGDAARFSLELPVRAAAEELELYAELRDAGDRVVARTGGPLAPYRLPVRAAEGGSVLEAWWLWAAVGGAVVVAGAGVAIGVAASSNERAPAGTLSPGRVELPLISF